MSLSSPPPNMALRTNPQINRLPAGKSAMRENLAFPSPCFGQLVLQLAAWGVAVVDVEGAPLRRHHHRVRECVDVETVGELAVGDRVGLVDSHPGQLRQRRLLMCAAHGTAVGGGVKD